MNDDDQIEDLCNNVRGWFDTSLEQMNCMELSELTLNKCKFPTKDSLAGMVWAGLEFAEKQNEQLLFMMKTVASLKSELIRSQQSVIELQEKLLDSKEVQLQTLQTTVKTSVQDTVKEEFRSYSSVVQQNSNQPPGESLSPENLKKVVKTVVQEEDRSRNLMVFGLAEDNEEKLCEKVGQLFGEIGAKPRVEACRVGKVTKDRAQRPVKVTLSNTAIVGQILARAKKLREVEQFKTVFISPDRSLDERAKRRQLVVDLKKKLVEEPGKKHYIKEGKLFSVEKTVE